MSLWNKNEAMIYSEMNYKGINYLQFKYNPTCALKEMWNSRADWEEKKVTQVPAKSAQHSSFPISYGA